MQGKHLAFFVARGTLLFNYQEGELMKKGVLKKWVVLTIITIQFGLFMLLSGECENLWTKLPLLALVIFNHIVLVKQSDIYAE